MNEKNKAFLITGAGLVLWVINQISTQPDGSQLFGILGNAIGTILFIWGIVKIVKAYRKKPQA